MKENKTNELQIFENPKFGKLRTVTIDGVTWFVGKDVTEALGYKNSNKALKDNVDEEDKGVTKVTTLGGSQNTTIINESGLYALVFGSRLKKAKEFKHWVTSDVLPQIRETGGYGRSMFKPDGSLDTNAVRMMLDDFDELQKRNNELENEVDELKLDNAVKAQQISDDEPKVAYYEKVLKCDNLLSVNTIAKDYGMSAIAFNQLLNELKIQYKRGDTWYLYQKYADHNYTKFDTWCTDNNVYYHMKWTQQGRLFLYDFLKDFGIVPKIEREETLPNEEESLPCEQEEQE